MGVSVMAGLATITWLPLQEPFSTVEVSAKTYWIQPNGGSVNTSFYTKNFKLFSGKNVAKTITIFGKGFSL